MSSNTNYAFAAKLSDVQAAGCTAVHVNGHTVALFAHNDHIYAVDNRCPHMGFPLDKGTVKDGILTCYWHYARFDLESGGTFDQFADDVRAFPVEIRDDEIWIDTTPPNDLHDHYRERLAVGLERDLPLVIGKAALVLLDHDSDPVTPFRVGLEFGTRYRRAGWGQGLTILVCMMNMLPYLSGEDKPRALYKGLAAVARESSGSAPRFPIRPLTTTTTDIPTFKRWFRQFIEVRDDEGAERCLVSAIRAGADDRQLADILFAAATDHRYIQIGHVADFTNKAFEALDIAGWDLAETVLPSLVTAYANASRQEESNAWRNPIDLIAILDEAFSRLPQAVAQGQTQRGRRPSPDELIPILLGDNPSDSVEALLAALAAGASETELAASVSYAAALRIARFHTSNEFSDWDTALHTFTFANAIEQGLRRAPSIELLRGVFDAAMSVYLDRFLNIPAAPLPQPNGKAEDAATLLTELPALLNRQQQVSQAADHVAHYLFQDGQPEQLLAMLGKLLLREDRDFHTIQTIEGAFKQFTQRRGSQSGSHALIAAARYLAAHAPTVRAQEQTFTIAQRLHRGERLFEG
ncbi:MAG: Rieske (2Fe-2S) protein [Anaerolineae bacterium]|nr:Rieske (2Fe-2S) protein [Anaerolineae bacterium]